MEERSGEGGRENKKKRRVNAEVWRRIECWAFGSPRRDGLEEGRVRAVATLGMTLWAIDEVTWLH